MEKDISSITLRNMSCNTSMPNILYNIILKLSMQITLGQKIFNVSLNLVSAARRNNIFRPSLDLFVYSGNVVSDNTKAYHNNTSYKNSNDYW